MTNTNYILYHKNCADGTASALAAYKYFGENATYIPCQYQESPPEGMPFGSTLYLVDFSFPQSVLDELIDGWDYNIVVLDHHKTAQDEIIGYGRLQDKVFDMERSGAMITWEYFFPNEPVPKLFHYIQDRDLWQWKYEETKPISAYLKTIGFNYPKAWSHLLEDEKLDSIIEKGQAINEYQDAYIGSQVKNFYWGSLPDGTGMWLCNNTHLISEVCNKFLTDNKDFQVCACWFALSDSERVYSLRSKKGFDCSTIAKRFGGGGHAQAAGFKMKKED